MDDLQRSSNLAIMMAAEASMGKLFIHDIEDELVQALERRAARHGRSTEAEHHAVLREALTVEEVRASFKEFLASMPDVGEDDDFSFPIRCRRSMACSPRRRWSTTSRW
jgi:plasmid stability protein